MTDLIHKGELFNALANAHDKGEIFAIIQNAQTVDAVPVVRCGECKHGHPDIMSEEYTACRYRQTVMPNDGFCSYGERINDD